MVVPNNIQKQSRGAFVLLEGVDRCGKTTQCQRLLQRLLTVVTAATSMRFPDRTTATGRIINEYLSSSESTALNDQAIHLLFSANRWEAVDSLQEHLRAGTTVVCDRYAYSGVAFSSAKESDGLSLEWCQAPDRGLPAPDCVIFLDLSQEEAEKRGGYGGERYEQRDMQLRVRERFAALQKMDSDTIPWHIVDAAQSMDQVEEDIWKIVHATLEQVANGKPLQKMWQDGVVDLVKSDDKEN